MPPSVRWMPGFLAEALSKPHNRAMLLLLRTAKEWKLPPTAVIRSSSTVGTWNEDDYLLASALTVLESETCSSCGTPAWLGHSTNNLIEFKVEEATCHACAELGKAEEERGKQKKKSHGKTFYPIARNVFKDRPLPTRHEEYERRRSQ